MKVDAFVFNGAICSGGPAEARIAPITQPNFLRLASDLVQNPMLDHAYLSYATPATNNSRYTDPEISGVWPRRRGVYLHWMLPRTYRSGTQSGPPADAAPAYLETPTRWLMARKFEMETVRPKRRSSLWPPSRRAELKTLEGATAHYWVISWHSIPDSDLFNDLSTKKMSPHKDLLKSLMMCLKSPDGQDT